MDEAPSQDLPSQNLPAGLEEADRRRIEGHGLSVDEVRRQLELLRHEPPPIRLDRACTPGDGIVTIESRHHAELQDRFQEAAGGGRFAKFVPASGAATRMFRSLAAVRRALAEEVPAEEVPEPDQDLQTARTFLAELRRFPFHDALADVLGERGLDLETLRQDGEILPVLEALLDDPAPGAPALGYSAHPKALIPFHRTPGELPEEDDEIKTPLDEHVEEAAEHLRSENGVCVVHFMIPQHREMDFRQAFRDVAGRLEARLGGRFELSCSIQRPSTDTVAIEAEGAAAGTLVRDEEGEILFRPGGHGALLPNLGDVAEDTGADLVFLRTIDNVLPAPKRREVLLWNRLLGGYLLELEEEIVRHLGALERAERAGGLGKNEVDDGLRFVAERLNLAHALDYMDRPLRVKHAWLVDRLDRPLRVCGMVRNEGEPGGGPFWVRQEDSAGEMVVTPQIVEQAQVDSGDEEQAKIGSGATHFSPASMVCRLRSHRGDPYDLDAFVDPRTVFLNTKFYGGRPIRVLERPGLWNGGMARWNTVFVEIPASIFAPVKTVFDLLRPAHQPTETSP